MINNKQTILIAAGASGGHVFPALAVAEELVHLGFTPVFIGSGKHFVQIVEKAGFKYYILPASPWNVKNPIRKIYALFNVARAVLKAMWIVHKTNPSVVFGTGGYATVASVIAGNISGVPTMIHEQNVLPGRANRFLAKRVSKIALAFEVPKNILMAKAENMKIIGNPMRLQVLDALKLKKIDNGKFNILIIGGSQGARIFSDVVPEAIKSLPKSLHGKLNIVQQAREEDLERVKQVYNKLNIQHKVASFFDNLPEEIVNTDLVISRAGASAVSECALLGKAAIFVPLQLADGHQILNAQVLTNTGAAIMMEAANFNSANLVKTLEELINNPQKIKHMEAQALLKATPNAAKDVAKEVKNLAATDVITMS